MVNIRRIWTLCGPNQWARFPVLEVWVELGEFQELRTDAVPGFCDRLLAWLPGLAQHAAPAGEGGSFADALRRGTTLAHVIERVVVELQTRAGNPVSFGLTQAVRNEPGVYQVVFQYEEPPVAEACLETACRLIAAAVKGQAFDLSAELERLTDLADRNRLGRASAAVVNAARKRNIPVEHLNPEDGRLVALGWGNKQRWLLAAQTDRTLQVAFALAAYKADTKKYPAKLEDLTPKYLKEVPTDLFLDDKPLIYKLREKGYQFYSVGVNGKDDSGKTYGDDPPGGDDLGLALPLPELNNPGIFSIGRRLSSAQANSFKVSSPSPSTI